MNEKVIVNLFNFINKKYKKLYMKITKQSNIYSSVLNTNDINYKIGPLDNLIPYGQNKFSYIDTNNELISNYHSMTLNIFNECLNLNEKICHSLGIENKLKNSGLDLKVLFENNKIKSIILILLFNYKYIRKNILK